MDPSRMGPNLNESATNWAARPERIATQYITVNIKPNMYESKPLEKRYLEQCSETSQHSKHEKSMEVAMPPVIRPSISIP
mmetsp:Transcript_13564/g.24481  ORF Transcript_13564/g.24481 Transcript_13564/m.24481 type:complete len:80 (-) Transcript_13564:568-807(-)